MSSCSLPLQRGLFTELALRGFAITILDNLSNSSSISVDRIKALVPKPELVEFVHADVNDAAACTEIVKRHSYRSVIHFAAVGS